MTDAERAPGPTVEVDFSYDSGAAGLRALLDIDPTIDGVCCSNDVIALGALREAQRCGRRVPEDLGVIGFDDIEVSAYSVPALTTVRIPKRTIGLEAAGLIRKALAGEPIEMRVIDVGFTLMRRNSH
jgi:LacI family gluconate utilization system Gnt-I transcriptional repressor